MHRVLRITSATVTITQVKTPTRRTTGMTRKTAQDRWALYGGKDPRDVPSYVPWEAARYLRMPLRTLHNWCFGFSTYGGRPLIHVADPDGHKLSFWNVAELHVLDSMRRYHQISPQKLRRLIDYMEKTFDTQHPLINEQMVTDGVSVFVERAGRLINATRDGQLAMRQLLQAHLQRIEQDVDGLAVRLYPFVYGKPKPGDSKTTEAPKIISLDPRVRFGRPVIAGTSIPTVEIAERFQAGDSFESLAKEYGRPKAEIEEAIRCELTLDSAA